MTRKDDNIVQLPDAEDIRMEAASWITILGREEVASADRESFRNWLSQSDRHKEAFQSLSALCADLSVLRQIDDVAESTVESVPLETRFFPRRMLAAVAASAAIVLVAGGVYQAIEERGLHQSGKFATAVGEQRSIKLADGSMIQLNTASEIEIAFSPSARIVRLISGEAYFDVAKDRRRPFSVQADDSLVTAVGTAFSVRMTGSNIVEVTVEEGRVALAKQLESPADAVNASDTVAIEALAQLSAGQSTRFNDAVEDIKQMPEAELKRKLSWRQGVLVYSGEPLAHVVEDISRYTDMRIDVGDPALLDRRVAGFLNIDDVDTSIASLALSFGLRLEEVGPNHVRLVEESL